MWNMVHLKKKQVTNIVTLAYIMEDQEDNNQIQKSNIYLLPTEYECEDTIETIN